MSNAPPAEIQALIDAHIKAFNTQNTELFLSVFGNTAVVIDGIAPYRWLKVFDDDPVHRQYARHSRHSACR